MSIPTGRWFDVEFGDGKFVAVSESSNSNNNVAYSSNGISWTIATTPTNMPLSSITYAEDSNNNLLTSGKLWLAIGTQGTQRVLTSPNGITWTAQTVPELSWQDSAYGAGRFVIVAFRGNGTDPAFSSSKDGITWEPSEDPESSDGYRAIIYGGGRFSVVAGSGTNKVATLVTSDDPSGLYFNNELVATRENLNPLIDKVNENTNDIGIVDRKTSAVLTGTSLPSFRPDGSDLADGDMFFLTTNSRLYVYFTNSWVQVTA